MIRIGNKVVAGSADVDLSSVLTTLNKNNAKVWFGTTTEYEALDDTTKNNDDITFVVYDTDEDIYLIADTIIAYNRAWSSVKVSTELAKKINASQVYTKEDVDQLIKSAVSSALKYKGAVNTTALLPASADNGDTYFVKADGFMYAYNSTSSTWDALGTVADMTSYFTKTEITALLQDKADKFQYDVLPTPSSETVGVLLQYTGADTEDYKNGYFYKGIDNGDDTYAWELAKIGEYYSKSEVDNLLNDKADAVDVEAIQEVIPSSANSSNKLPLIGKGDSNAPFVSNTTILNYLQDLPADTTIVSFATSSSATAVTDKASSTKGCYYEGMKVGTSWQITAKTTDRTESYFTTVGISDTSINWTKLVTKNEINENCLDANYFHTTSRVFESGGTVSYYKICNYVSYYPFLVRCEGQRTNTTIAIQELSASYYLSQKKYSLQRYLEPVYASSQSQVSEAEYGAYLIVDANDDIWVAVASYSRVKITVTSSTKITIDGTSGTPVAKYKVNGYEANPINFSGNLLDVIKSTADAVANYTAFEGYSQLDKEGSWRGFKKTSDIWHCVIITGDANVVLIKYNSGTYTTKKIA